MFIGQWLRSAEKPECISAQTLRARARAWRRWPQLVGESFGPYSTIASVSQTARPSSTSTAPARRGFRTETRLKSESASKLSKRTMRSSKGMPACLSSTQGRMDQDE